MMLSGKDVTSAVTEPPAERHCCGFAGPAAPTPKQKGMGRCGLLMLLLAVTLNLNWDFRLLF